MVSHHHHQQQSVTLKQQSTQQRQVLHTTTLVLIAAVTASALLVLYTTPTTTTTTAITTTDSSCRRCRSHSSISSSPSSPFLFLVVVFGSAAFQGTCFEFTAEPEDAWSGSLNEKTLMMGLYEVPMTNTPTGVQDGDKLITLWTATFKFYINDEFGVYHDRQATGTFWGSGGYNLTYLTATFDPKILHTQPAIRSVCGELNGYCQNVFYWDVTNICFYADPGESSTVQDRQISAIDSVLVDVDLSAVKTDASSFLVYEPNINTTHAYVITDHMASFFRDQPFTQSPAQGEQYNIQSLDTNGYEPYPDYYSGSCTRTCLNQGLNTATIYNLDQQREAALHTAAPYPVLIDTYLKNQELFWVATGEKIMDCPIDACLDCVSPGFCPFQNVGAFGIHPTFAINGDDWIYLPIDTQTCLCNTSNEFGRKTTPVRRSTIKYKYIVTPATVPPPITTAAPTTTTTTITTTTTTTTTTPVPTTSPQSTTTTTQLSSTTPTQAPTNSTTISPTSTTLATTLPTTTTTTTNNASASIYFTVFVQITLALDISDIRTRQMQLIGIIFDLITVVLPDNSTSTTTPAPFYQPVVSIDTLAPGSTIVVFEIKNITEPGLARLLARLEAGDNDLTNIFRAVPGSVIVTRTRVWKKSLSKTAVGLMCGAMGCAVLIILAALFCCISQRKKRRLEEVAKLEEMRDLEFNPLHFSIQEGRLLVRGLPVQCPWEISKSSDLHPVGSGTMTVHDITDEYDVRPHVHIKSPSPFDITSRHVTTQLRVRNANDTWMRELVSSSPAAGRRSPKGRPPPILDFNNTGYFDGEYHYLNSLSSNTQDECEMEMLYFHGGTKDDDNEFEVCSFSNNIDVDEEDVVSQAHRSARREVSFSEGPPRVVAAVRSHSSAHFK